MISKTLRLKENEVKKVLSKWKPFFSYSIVVNYLKNKLNYSRYAIVISWKSVKNAVHRNYFRRRFYNDIAQNIGKINWYDLIFVVKTKSKLDMNIPEDINSFHTDINFLIKKVNLINNPIQNEKH